MALFASRCICDTPSSDQTLHWTRSSCGRWLAQQCAPAPSPADRGPQCRCWWGPVALFSLCPTRRNKRLNVSQCPQTAVSARSVGVLANPGQIWSCWKRSILPLRRQEPQSGMAALRLLLLLLCVFVSPAPLLIRRSLTAQVEEYFYTFAQDEKRRGPDFWLLNCFHWGAMAPT